MNRRQPLAALSALLLAAPASALPPGWDGVDREITITTVPKEMRYDIRRFRVEPGEKVKLTLVNEDELQHNLIICKAVDRAWLTVAQAAWALAEKGPDLEFVPQHELVLHAGRMVDPGQRDVLYFVAPETPGLYPYVCTFPGHAFLMRGTMAVGDSRLGLSGVRYRYYEGSWQRLPDFTTLQPAAEGALEEGLFDLSVRKRNDQFALLFEGTLSVPADGRYRFTLASDDGSRLRIGGKTVVDHDGVHGMSGKDGAVDLKRGDHPIELAYFEQSGGEELQLHWSGSGVARQALTPGAAGQDPARHHLFVTGEARVARMKLPDSSSRAIAVGLPTAISYCFDTADCSVRYAWFGGFLDAGPDRGNGTGRGGGTAKLLGERFDVGYRPGVLRIGDREPETRFLGYLRKPDAAVLQYTLNGIPVAHTVTAAPEGIGIRHHFALGKAPPAPVVFSVQPDRVIARSDVGAFENGVLTVPPDRARAFTVTLIKK